jgi:hypothetical protein
VTGLPSRRATLAFTTGLALAGSAFAADRVTVIDAARVYPFLERFLRLPPTEHDRFVLAYYAYANGKPATTLKLSFTAGADRWPVPVAADGLIERTPTLRELQSDPQVIVEGPDGVTLSITQEVHPSFPPAQEMDANEIRAALAQVTAATHRLAGPFSFIAPSLQRAEFHGVGGIGEAVYADGHVVRLKLCFGNPCFDADMVGVVRLRFPRRPERIELEPKD